MTGTLSVVLTILSAENIAEKLLGIVIEGDVGTFVCPFEKAELVIVPVRKSEFDSNCYKIIPFIVDVPPEHFGF